MKAPGWKVSSADDSFLHFLSSALHCHGSFGLWNCPSDWKDSIFKQTSSFFSLFHRSHSHGNCPEAHEEKKTVLRSQRQPKSLRFFSPRGQENPKQEAEQNQQQPLTSQRAEQYGAAAHLQSSSGCRKRGVCFTKSSPMMNCDTASPAAQTLEELLILTQDYFHKTVP